MTYKRPKSEFEKATENVGVAGFFTDFWYFLRHSRKWWMLPLLSVLLLLAFLLLLSGTAVAPFIYTLF